MRPDGDPEQQIADLERPLSAAAAGSEVSSIASKPRVGMRVGWIVLGLLILGLVVSGGVIVSGRLASTSRPVTGSPTTPAVVGGGGVVPGRAPVTTSMNPSRTVMPSASPTTAGTVSSAPPGGALSVAGVGNERTLACNDSAVSISGVDNTVVLTGRCARVDVSGVNNTVTIDEAAAIDVSGMDNKVVFHTGTPELNQSGFDNTLERG